MSYIVQVFCLLRCENLIVKPTFAFFCISLSFYFKVIILMGLFSRLTTILVLVVVFFIILTHRLSLMSQDSSTISTFKDRLVKLKTIIQTSLPDISDFHVFGVENSQDDDDQVVADTALFNTSSSSTTHSSNSEEEATPQKSLRNTDSLQRAPKMDPFKILEAVENSVHSSSATASVTRTSTASASTTSKTATPGSDVESSSVSGSAGKVVSTVPLKAKGFNPKELLNAKREPDAPQLDHPLYSPRPGSDISEANQMNLLQCPNQSSCIVPELQLKVKLRVYFCKHPIRGGVRFYFLAREGFLLHPNVEMVEESEMNTADYIIYLPASAPWQKSECNASTHTAKKMIVLDEFDGVTPLYSPLPTFKEMKEAYGPSLVWYFLYFKRSYVGRRDGEFIKYAHAHKHDVYPLTYPLAEAYIQLKFNQVREIDIMCTLRGSKEMSTRLRAQEWVTEYVKARGITNAITGQVCSHHHAYRSCVFFLLSFVVFIQFSYLIVPSY